MTVFARARVRLKQCTMGGYKRLVTYSAFMELFASSSGGGSSSKGAVRKNVVGSSSKKRKQEATSDGFDALDNITSFKELGLCDWLLASTAAMGFRRPTDIQKACIPAILDGRNVMGCAETGSGKTAAFALPVLHHLSSDPYGIFAVVLTPTRELAIQIAEQFAALGAPLGLRTCLIIGGVNMTTQSMELAKRPHVVIATPGRLRHHMTGADPPNLGKALYLILDEADRLLQCGFEAELSSILGSMHDRRQTLLFSATLTESLSQLEKMASVETLRFDLTLTQKVPSTLLQQYLFMPLQVKLGYLVAVLRTLIIKQIEQREVDGASGDINDDTNIEAQRRRLMDILEVDDQGSNRNRSRNKNKNRSLKSSKKDKMKSDAGGSGNAEDSAQFLKSSSSIIIFVASCRRAQEITETLLQLGFDCVALHSMMSQPRRLASLGKFKSHVCRLMVATDVASRGLDIPSLDLVVNYDLPKEASDYIHRIGRTARAGRSGRSLSLVTQYDVPLVHAIEELTAVKMALSVEVKEEEVVKLLNSVSKAERTAKLRLSEVGFDEQAEKFASRKKARKDRNGLGEASAAEQ